MSESSAGGGGAGRFRRLKGWVPSWSRRRWAVAVLLGVVFVVLVAVGGFYAYFEVFAHHAPDDVVASVAANENVTVEAAYGGYVVRPSADGGGGGGGGEPSGSAGNATAPGEGVGIVFYPGGRVAPDAYLPSAARIVERTGATVFVPKVPANLAVLDQDRAADVIENEPGIETWVVGGHSLGGAMACRYAASDPASVDGVLLVGAYCDRPVRDVPVLSLVGTRDAVLDRDRFQETLGNLPETATVVSIEGMNHSQAGWYTGQRGGQRATISTRDAHLRLATQIAYWLMGVIGGLSPAR